MNQLADRIAEIHDAAAVRLLSIVADAVQDADETALVTESTGDVRTAVADFAKREDARVPETATDGDVARAALLVLAEDQDQARYLATMLEGPGAEKFVGFEVVLAAGAVLVALRTRFKFSIKDGKMQFEIGKAGLSGKNLVDLAGKLTAWWKTK